jgi:hypothetical protein
VLAVDKRLMFGGFSYRELTKNISNLSLGHAEKKWWLSVASYLSSDFFSCVSDFQIILSLLFSNYFALSVASLFSFLCLQFFHSCTSHL